jgi:hypothetical protein
MRSTGGMAECTPEAPGFVRSSADDRTFSLPGYNDGLTAQIQVVPLLDGRIERVHIDMEDFAHTSLATILSPAQGQL